MKRVLPFVSNMAPAVVLCIAALSFAGTYYVDQNNPAARDQNPGTLDQPWKTLIQANRVASAGDTVFLREGTYTSFVAPDHSGSSASPLVYQNYRDELVTISNGYVGIYLNGKSYVVVHGIHFFNLDQFLWLQNSANHNIIEYCYFDQGRNIGWSGSVISKNSSYNWIHHCQLSNYGYYHYDDIGSILDIGDEESQTDFSNYNLIEDNLFFHGGHHILGVFSMFNVIRRNYFHNEPWATGTAASDRGAVLYGNRNVYFSGYPANSARNLFEKNRIAYSADPPDNIGASGLALNTSYNIIRFNQFYYNDRAGISMTLTSSYYSDIIENKIYNNTFFCNGINTEDPVDHMNSGIGFGLYSGSHIIKDNVLKNNLLYKHRIPFGTYRVELTGQILDNNWDGDEQGDPKFLNASEVLGDPMDSVNPDLHLQAGSSCRDAGSYLTTIVSAGSSGRVFEVKDAGYFMDGWGIVQGDTIRLYGSDQSAIITHIDYQSNSMTIDRTLTWIKDQGICLAFEGTAPDVGAIELPEISKPLPPANLRFIKNLAP